MKYRDRIEQLEELGNESMERFLLKEVLTKMETTCRSCQRDRMRCTLRPLCSDRIFLNILISLGAVISDLPTFCYQVHLRNLQSYLKAKARRTHPHEPRFPLKYFRRFVPFKKGEHEENMEAFAAYLEKTTQSTVHRYALQNTWYFGVGYGIFIVDLKRQLVSLDPDNDAVHLAALEPLLMFLGEMHRLKLTILKDLEQTWYLRMILPPFPSEQTLENVQPLLVKLETIWSYVTINTMDQETQVLISLDPVPNQVIRLKTLRETVQILVEITKAVTTEKAPSTVASEKASTTVETVARAGR